MDALAGLGGRVSASPTPSRSTALIDSWRTTADGAGSKTALGAALHARSLRSSLYPCDLHPVAFSWGKPETRISPWLASTARPLRVTHYEPTTFCPPELRVPHAVVVTVREEGRPPSRGQLLLARSPLSTRVAILWLYRVPPVASRRVTSPRLVSSRLVSSRLVSSRLVSSRHASRRVASRRVVSRRVTSRPSRVRNVSHSRSVTSCVRACAIILKEYRRRGRC